MELTYQVDRAWWGPSYDLRVTSDPKSPTTKHAKLHYFANIQQTSGEDWNDAEIELSTAEPRRAGSVPQRETLNAKLRRRRLLGLDRCGSEASPPLFRMHFTS